MKYLSSKPSCEEGQLTQVLYTLPIAPQLGQFEAGTKAQQPGTPLSDQEYHQFFNFLKITVQANTACHLREMYGCKNSLVQRLDEYENHGVIPPGQPHPPFPTKLRQPRFLHSKGGFM
uniref:Acrosin-binding protein n=1 Tax=Catharus ustulatus TaxID=91951 RepID=A0A8C3Y1E5_CATUS